VNRFRSIARHQLLPFVLGALVLRALIPAGFMPGPSAGLSLVAMMCASPAPGAAGTELIEIPGGMPVSSHSHCDFCGLPMLGAPDAAVQLPSSPAIEFHSLPERVNAPHSRFALARAQIPRAPPLA
jgi:hypothetical protein